MPRPHVAGRPRRAYWQCSRTLSPDGHLRLDHNEIEDDIVEVLPVVHGSRGLGALTLDDTCLSEGARAALQALPLPAGVLELLRVRDDS